MDNLNNFFPVGEANAVECKVFVGANLYQGKAWLSGNTATEVNLTGEMPWWPPGLIPQRDRAWVIAGVAISALVIEPIDPITSTFVAQSETRPPAAAATEPAASGG